MNPIELTDLEQLINDVFNTYFKDGIIKADQLPNIDLYVDQVTSFLGSKLSGNMRYDDDKIMTKTMINNYTKYHLLPPPEKKKYSKDHMILMILIIYFKNFLSISDIRAILDPLSEKYFHSDDDLDLEAIYNSLCVHEGDVSKSLYAYAMNEKDMVENLFNDAPDEDRDYLRKFAFICIMSLDIYIKKQLVEKMIDQFFSPDSE